MMKSRGMYLAVAVFALFVQVAAASHLPVHEEPVSECQEPLSHFCADTVEHHPGPCVFCQVSLNGVFFESVLSPRAALQTEPTSAAVVRPSDASIFVATHAPRGPPVC